MTRILAVDDSPSMRQMVGVTLKSAGYEVLEASDGCEALNIAKQRCMSGQVYKSRAQRFACRWVIRRRRLRSSTMRSWCLSTSGLAVAAIEHHGHQNTQSVMRSR
jgi:DNA-binding response OmpR family regulator